MNFFPVWFLVQSRQTESDAYEHTMQIAQVGSIKRFNFDGTINHGVYKPILIIPNFPIQYLIFHPVVALMLHRKLQKYMVYRYVG